MKLRISRAGGAITVTLPQHISDRKAAKMVPPFIEANRNWLEEQLSQSSPPKIVTWGTDLMLSGEFVSITRDVERTRGVYKIGNQLYVGGTDPSLVAGRVKSWLRREAERQISDSLLYHKAVMNIETAALGFGDMKSRWGSCSSKGDVKFNIRLAMMPPAVLDYVVIHELAHRIHMDHSAAFWTVVEGACPDYKFLKKRLSDLSPIVQSYQF